MDTQQKKPVRPGSKKKAAPRPGTKTTTKRPASGSTSDRARREAAARAAKIKSMKLDAKKKAAKRPVRKPRRPMEPVVYTQPKVFNRSRLMIQLVSLMALVLATVLCFSIFFRVKHVTVTGNNAYSAWAIREASGIEDGDYLLTFSKARACAKIEAALPYVQSVRIGIKLPDTVNIVIEEIDVVYAIQCSENMWWLITSDGIVMEQSTTGDAANYTRILGVKLDSPEPGEEARAYTEQAQGGTVDANGETQEQVPVTVTQQERLDAALVILKALERNEVVGEAASINVKELSLIELWYGTRYQVNLGTLDDMDYKIATMKATIARLSDYDSGVLDISFTTWPDKVGYTPFD